MTYDNKKKAGALLFFASAQFLLILVVVEALYPDYSVSQNYISDLGVGPVSLPFNSSVFLLGITTVVGAYFLQRAFTYKVLFVFLILTGIGAMGVGLFPEDIPVPHSIAAMVTFLFGGFSAIASSKLLKSPLSYFSVFLGVLSLVALVLFATNVCLGLGPGGMERMVAYPTLLWGVGFGSALMSYPDK